MVEENLIWLRWPDWEAESVAATSDLAVLPFFAVFFLVVRFCLDKVVFEVWFTWGLLGVYAVFLHFISSCFCMSCLFQKSDIAQEFHPKSNTGICLCTYANFELPCLLGNVAGITRLHILQFKVFMVEQGIT